MRRTSALVITFCLLAVLFVSLPAQAWGPKARMAVVSNALHMLSKENNIPLRQLAAEVRQGLMISPVALEKMHPRVKSDPIGTIETEIFLLQKVKGDKIDPYFAYRLGVLGRMTADVAAPMTLPRTGQSDLYNADIERNIQRGNVKVKPRHIIESRRYLEDISMQANARNNAISREYQGGIGFQGLAQGALSEDVSRCINTIADVWYSTLVSASGGAFSGSQRKDYVADAYAFYIDRGNLNEINNMAQKLDLIAEKTPELQVHIGDQFYAAGMYEEAIRVYKEVLAVDPGRKEVAERIATYYSQLGEEAIKEDRLDDAVEAYNTAMEASPTSEEVAKGRGMANKLQSERNARQQNDQALLEEAGAFEMLAEQEASRGRFAEAIALLKQTEGLYESVSVEFPLETRERTMGLNNVRERVLFYKQEIIEDAQRYSGSGMQLEVRSIASQQNTALRSQALQEMSRELFQQELMQLQDSLENSISIQ